MLAVDTAAIEADVAQSTEHALVGSNALVGVVVAAAGHETRRALSRAKYLMTTTIYVSRSAWPAVSSRSPATMTRA